jgi:hypothetical protein
MHTEVMLKATDMPNEIVPISAGRKVAPAGRVGERLSRRNSFWRWRDHLVRCGAERLRPEPGTPGDVFAWRAWAQYSPASMSSVPGEPYLLIPDPNRLGADQMLRCLLEGCLTCPRLLGSTDAAPVGVFPQALQGRCAVIVERDDWRFVPASGPGLEIYEPTRASRRRPPCAP